MLGSAILAGSPTQTLSDLNVKTHQGGGDQGEALVLPDGHTCQRLPQLHRRRYVSIFGEFLLQRTAYGSREGQRVEFVPLDNRLQLPASAFSYLLQDWDQALCAEQAFGQASATIARILGLEQSVDSLEQMNADMAARVDDFREGRPMPAPQQEGELLVVSADGKGVVMRRQASDAPAPPHRAKGEKASHKRMATVGAAYSVDRYPRTPEQVVAALFRDGPRTRGRGPSRSTSTSGPAWEAGRRGKPARARTSSTPGCLTRWRSGTGAWSRRWFTCTTVRRRCGRRARGTCPGRTPRRCWTCCT